MLGVKSDPWLEKIINDFEIPKNVLEQKAFLDEVGFFEKVYQNLIKLPPQGQKWLKRYMYLNHPLQIAILIGDTALINSLINENSFDPKVENSQGTSLLCYAAYFGKIQILDCLVNNYHLNIKETDEHGLTPLHYAAQSGNIEMLEHLIHTYNLDVNKTTKDGSSLLHSAAYSGHIEMFDKLVTQKRLTVTKTNDRGGTPLYCAAMSGNMDMLQHLINKHDLKVRETANDGSTLLHWAAFSGHIKMLKHLINNGLDANKTTNDGRTLLHFAAYCGHIKMLEHLTNTYNLYVNNTTEDGSSLLYYAAMKNNMEMFITLMDHPYSLDPTLQDHEGKTYGDYLDKKAYYELELLLLSNFKETITKNRVLTYLIELSEKKEWTDILTRLKSYQNMSNNTFAFFNIEQKRSPLNKEKASCTIQ